MTKKDKKARTIRKFDHLGQDEQFEYGGAVYTIPAISHTVSEDLAVIAKAMKDDIDAEDFMGANTKTFDYVCVAMAACHSREELEKLPRQIISAIMRLISEEMLGIPDSMEEGEKEEAKKQ